MEKLMRVAPLTDSEWSDMEIAVGLEPSPRGRKRVNLRMMLDGIFWVLMNQAAWRDVPARFGKWDTVYRYWRMLCRDHIWFEALHIISLVGIQRAVLTKVPDGIIWLDRDNHFGSFKSRQSLLMYLVIAYEYSLSHSWSRRLDGNITFSVKTDVDVTGVKCTHIHIYDLTSVKRRMRDSMKAINAAHKKADMWKPK